MKTISLFIFAIQISLYSFAQHTVKGIVVDENKAAQPFTKIALVSIDSSQKAIITQTDESGNFELKAIDGYYLFYVNDLYNKTIDVSEDIDIGQIVYLPKLNKELEDVQVIAYKKGLSLNNGKLIFTPPQNSAQSVFELLKTTPTLLVSEESLEILGKGTPGIMINGRWQRMPLAQIIAYLKTIPADKLQHIELVKQPGAELDAENKNGYINIVLKETKERGILGSIILPVSQATYLSTTPSANIDVTLGKLQLNSNIGFGKGKQFIDGSNTIHYPDKHWKEYNRNDRAYSYLTTNVSGDYELNKANIVGATFSWNKAQNTGDEYNSTLILDSKKRTNIDSTLLTTGLNPEHNQNYAVNLNYLHKFDTLGNNVKVDLDHFQQSFNRNQEFSNYTFDKDGNLTNPIQTFRSGNHQEMGITTANIAVEHPQLWAHVSYGAKFTFIRNANKTSFYQQQNNDWEADPNRFDNFVYDETTYAAFGKLNKEIDKWNLTLGLRLEHTQTKGSSRIYNIENKNDYTKLFPSGNVTYVQNNDNVFSFSYAYRIDRPVFAQVNPFRWYHNQYAFTNGNPSLQPFFSHNIDVDYIFKQRHTFSLYYIRSLNVFSEYDFVNPDNYLRETKVDNILNTSLYGANFATQFNLFKNWLLIPQAGVSYNQIFSKATFLQNSAGLFIFGSLQQQIYLDKKKLWFADLSTYYYAPRKYGVMQFKTIWSQSLALTYSTSNKQWQFVLAANDIFKTAAMRYNSIINETLRERYVYRDQRNISLRIRYNFKTGQLKENRIRSRSNKDEMDRI